VSTARWNRTKAVSEPCPRCGAASGETCRGLDHGYLHAPRLTRGASLTYDFGTSGGSSGTGTSEERAERLKEASKREEAIIRLLDSRGLHRLTTRDIALRLYGDHHDAHPLTSSAVTNMLNDVRLVMLDIRGDGGKANLVCLPENRNDDPLARRRTHTPPTEDEPDADYDPPVSAPARVVDLTWVSELVSAVKYHDAHEVVAVEVRTQAGNWRDVIDYIPEEYK
jgi:hypothetical protein